VYADLIYSTALTFANTGRIEEAVAIAAAALESGKVTDHTPIALSRVHTAHAMWLNILGRLDAALSAVNRAAELLQESTLHFTSSRMNSCAVLGFEPEVFLTDRWSASLTTSPSQRPLGRSSIGSMRAFLLAEAHLAKGDSVAALDLIEEGTAIRNLERGIISVFRPLEGPRALALVARGQFAGARAVMEVSIEGERLYLFFLRGTPRCTCGSADRDGRRPRRTAAHRSHAGGGGATLRDK